MQRTLLTCSTRAVVTSQVNDLGAAMDSSPKSSEAAKMLIILTMDIEAKAESIILPFQKTLVFSFLEDYEQFCYLHPSRNIVELQYREG